MSAADALKAARDAGVQLGLDGDDLMLEASAPPPPAILDLLSRHKAEVLTLLHATARQSTLPAPTPSLSNAPQLPEPGLEEPCAARRGRVQEINGALMHFCVECGRFGAFGYGVNLRAGRLGRGYCREHWPDAQAKTTSLQRRGESDVHPSPGDPAESRQAELAAVKQIQTLIEAMTLEQIQAELRAISGTPLRDDADRLRRRELWQRLDAPSAAASLMEHVPTPCGRECWGAHLAAELVKAHVDVIYVGGDVAIRAAHHATATIPILGVIKGTPISYSSAN
jgi:hypothetical protein